jgi:hypothetical protein
MSKIEQLWYTRQVNKPWRDGDDIKIHVRGDTLDKELQESAYFTSAIVDAAVQKIFNFYGRQPAIQATEITQEAHYFVPRPNTKPSLLISVKESRVADAPFVATPSTSTAAFSRTYSTRRFLQRGQEIATLFKDYQKQYKFFDGSVEPGIDFVQEYNRLFTAISKVKDFIEFNKLPYRTDEDDDIVINFDAEYRILGISLIHRAQEKILTRGVIYYLEDSRGLNNKRTNELLYNLGSIHSHRKKPVAWTEFLEKYVPSVTVNFFGRPRTEKCSNVLLQKQDKNNPVIMTLKELEEEVEYINNPANRECLMTEAAAEKIKNNEDIKKIAEGIQKFSDKAEMVQRFIDKYGINHLIEAALECLAYQTGVARSDMPPIPGVDPFKPRKPPAKLKLPAIRLPPIPPTISIAHPITTEIKKALLESLMSALVGTLEALGAILLELCHQEDEDPHGIPLNELIDNFPNPAEATKEGGIQGGMNQCYLEYGIAKEVGDEFLGLVAANVTPREICNLVNGAPSPNALQVLKNLIEFTPSLETLRTIFADEDDLVGFFVCIGNLLSPGYCASLQPITPADLDPCTVEALLASAVDDQLFDDLINAYNDPDSLLPDGFDLGCGKGIVPPLTEMPQFRHSLQLLFNTLFEFPKTTFASDITGLKTIYMKPQPGCSQQNADLRDALKEIEDAQSEGDGDIGDGDTSKDMRAIKDLFPTSLLKNSMFGGVVDLIESAANSADAEVPGCAGIGVVYEIAREYREDLAQIDSRISYPYENDPAYSNMYFYFAPQQTYAGDARRTAWFSIGSGPNGDTQLGLAPQGSNTAIGSYRASYAGHATVREEIAGEFFDTVFGTFMQREPRPCGDTGRDLCMARWSLGWTYDPDLQTEVEGVEYTGVWSWPASAGRSAGSAPAALIDALTLAGSLFGLTDAPPVITQEQIDAASATQANTAPLNENSGPLKEAAKTDLYFNAYMSLINSVAYNVRNSNLFTVEGFKKLALVPAPCGDGRLYGGDLFDLDAIINEGLSEFAENSCSDRTCKVGPVEDSLIFGATNAYIQILLLEQLLKNIFLIDAYGAAAMIDNAVVTKEIIDGIYESIEEGGKTGPAFLREALQEAAVMYVDKVRSRQEFSNRLPKPGGDAGETITIDAAVLGDPDAYGKYAFEYLVKKRMANTIPVFKDLFGADEPNFNASFISNGLPTVEVNNKPLARVHSLNQPPPPSTGRLHKRAIPSTDPEVFGDLGYYALIDENDNNMAYNYGLDLSRTGAASTLSIDEVEYGRSKGLFTRERFISFDVNYDSLAEKASGGEVSREIFDTLNPLFRWNHFLPSPNTYDYAAGGPSTMVVSQREFTRLVEDYRRLDTSRVAAALSRVTVYQRDTELFGEIDVTYYLHVHLSEEALSDRTNETDPGDPDNGIDPTYWNTEAKTGPSTQVAVKGPMRRRNYDSIRFWNRVQLYGVPDDDWDLGGGDSVSPTATRGGETAISRINPGGGSQLNQLAGSEVRVVPNARKKRTYQGAGGYRAPGAPFLEDPDGIDASYVVEQIDNDPPARDHMEAIADTNYGYHDFRDELYAVGDQSVYTDLNNRIRLQVPKRFVDTRAGSTNSSDLLHDGGGAAKNGFYSYRIKKKDLFPSEHNISMWFGVSYRALIDIIAPQHGFDEGMLMRWWTGDATSEEKEIVDAFVDAHKATPATKHLGILGAQNAGVWGTSYVGGHDSWDSWRSNIQNALSSGKVSGPKSGETIMLPGADLHGQDVGISLGGPGYSSTWYADHRDESLAEFMGLDPEDEDEDSPGKPPLTEAALPCKNQTEIDQTISMGGTVPAGRGCPGTTHAPISLPALAGIGIEPARLDISHIYDFLGLPLPPRGTARNKITEAFSEVISNIRAGTRIIYNTPYMQAGDDTMVALQKFYNGVGLDTQRQHFLSTRSDYLTWNPAVDLPQVEAGQFMWPSPAGYVLHVNTGIEATTGIPTMDFLVAASLAGPDRIKEIFDSKDAGLIADIASQEKYKFLFNHIFDAEKIVGFIFLYGQMKTEDQSSDFNHLFDDTKQAIRTIIRAALAGDDYTHIDPEAVSDSDRARQEALGIAGAAGGVFAQMGASFVLKMLIETPLRILKGLAEIMDPHVIVGNAIRDVTGQAIVAADPIWSAAQSAAGFGVAAAGGLPPPTEEQAETAEAVLQEIGAAALDMDLPEFMQAGIDEAFSELPRPLRPKVSDKGLNLIGTLPFMFAVPPFIFGIIYILLDLMNADWGLPEPTPDPDCAGYLPPPAPALPPLIPVRSADDAEDADDVSPCDDDEEEKSPKARAAARRLREAAEAAEKPPRPYGPTDPACIDE